MMEKEKLEIVNKFWGMTVKEIGFSIIFLGMLFYVFWLFQKQQERHFETQEKQLEKMNEMLEEARKERDVHLNTIKLCCKER